MFQYKFLTTVGAQDRWSMIAHLATKVGQSLALLVLAHGEWLIFRMVLCW
jgi:hypothetical protein